jgi:hypothetical protein
MNEPIPFFGWLEEEVLHENDIIETQGRLLRTYAERLDALETEIKELKKLQEK